jgi:hypothetical protein
MATLLGFLVGFAMFGALLTIPLYLQIVTGLTPTVSGFATLPMIGGLMISSIVSGQIVSRTGRYRIFPVIGTAFTAVGYVVLTFMTVDRPLWFLMIGMFLIGLGIGQLMQTITLASQNSVAPRDMGVATSSATFFRQIGGTLGTAVLLSVLFSLLPGNVLAATANKTDLTSALDAALNPTVASASQNSGVMKQIWNPIVTPIEKNVQAGLDKATTQITSSVPAAQQGAALQAAATKANASVVDGKIQVDYSNAAQRSAVVKEVTPGLSKQLNAQKNSTSASSTSDSSDTSYLNGADKRLTRPFLTGFNNSAVTIYWVGLGVILLAFILTWFFKVPPLRKSSALQEQADNDGDGNSKPESKEDMDLAAARAGVDV